MNATTTAMAEPRIEAEWLHAPAPKAVLEALGPSNARFVGGAVRDSLLGRPVADIDLATSLLPEEVTRRLEAAGLKAVPVGIAHGTVTAVAYGEPLQITTLRKDIETFGRHARVAFTDDWQADAARRDFTMNALYADHEGRISDYFGGIADALAGRVRFIGNAEERIEEDALRILRFFRFHAHYGRNGLDAEGLAACRRKCAMLDLLSIERVRDELLRLLDAPDPIPTLQAMRAAGVLAHILPAVDGLSRLEALLERERRIGQRDPLRRLAALLPLKRTVLDAESDRLKLSNADRKRLLAMAGPPPACTRQTLRAEAYRIGRKAAIDRLLLSGDGENGDLEQAVVLLESWTPPRFPVGGRDLREAGIPSGPELGRRLAELEKRWIESDFTLSKAQLLEGLGSVGS